MVDAVDFPTLITKLIKGLFDAIVEASIQHMESCGQRLANVAKTADQFTADSIKVH